MAIVENFLIKTRAIIIMKRIILLILLIIPSLLLAQKAEKELAQKWLRVYQHELDDLPKSALAVVDSIYTLSTKRGLEKHVIKALIYQSKFALTLEENAQLSIVNNFKEAIADAKAPEKNILESLLAELYLSYYQQNRWRINRRTKTAQNEEQVDIDDFRTWDIETILATAKQHFENSLFRKEMLQQIAIADYSMLLDQNGDGEIYRPTLYDFLAHKVLAFYGNQAKEMDMPADAYILQDTAYFLQFMEVAKPQISYFNPEVATVDLYKELLRFHTEQRNTAAEVSLRIEILKFLLSNANITNSNAYFKKALQELAERFSTSEAVTLLYFESATVHYNTQQKVQALAICKKAIAAFPESHGAEKCQQLKREILSIDLAIKVPDFLPINKHSKMLVEYTNIDSLQFQMFEDIASTAKCISAANNRLCQKAFCRNKPSNRTIYYRPYQP